MKDLQKRIYDCRRCKDFDMVLVDEQKPCLEFRIHNGLENREVEAVFFAESPPPAGYFYDNERRGRTGYLREGLLSLLGITMKGFKEKYFLTDSLKCRVRKNGGIRKRQIECGKEYKIMEKSSKKRTWHFSLARCRFLGISNIGMRRQRIDYEIFWG